MARKTAVPRRLGSPEIVQPWDGKGGVFGQRGGSADPLRLGIGERGSRVARDGRWTVDDGRNACTDVIKVVSKAVNEWSGRSFLASLDSFLNAGVLTLVRSLLI